MDVEKLLGILLLLGTTFKAFTSASKDIHDMKAKKKNDALRERVSVASNQRGGKPPLQLNYNTSTQKLCSKNLVTLILVC